MHLFLPLATIAHFKTLAWVIYIIIIIIAIALIIQDKKDPVKALAWITVVALLPTAGIILYILFGRNHRKAKMFDRSSIESKINDVQLLAHEQTQLLGETDNIFLRAGIAENRDMITLLLNNSHTLLTVKNRVKVLNNGKDTFASLLKALRRAKESIHMEYYIFENDRIGGKIASILMEKARAGVEVRFIYDDVGSWSLSHKFIKELRKAGVQVGCFMPVVFPWLSSKINYRNHRKIVVIDGVVGYTGGINIADRYMRRGHKTFWRDTHLKVEGDAVNMLQMVFSLDWYTVSDKELLTDEKYFPVHTIDEEVPMQIAASGPDSDWASIMQAFFAAINRAEKHIYISTPYFLPNQAILTALKVASLSGIDVRLMIPRRSDSKIVHWATLSYISELLEAGIKVYAYNKGFNHSKVILIDGRFSSVGTANMDIRSFEDNFEVTALMYAPEVTTELEGYFKDDLKHCTEITASRWAKRSRLHNIYESLARLLSPLL